MKYAGNALVKEKLKLCCSVLRVRQRKMAAPIETEMARWSSG